MDSIPKSTSHFYRYAGPEEITVILSRGIAYRHDFAHGTHDHRHPNVYGLGHGCPGYCPFRRHVTVEDSNPNRVRKEKILSSTRRKNLDNRPFRCVESARYPRLGRFRGNSRADRHDASRSAFPHSLRVFDQSEKEPVPNVCHDGKQWQTPGIRIRGFQNGSKRHAPELMTRCQSSERSSD